MSPALNRLLDASAVVAHLLSFSSICDVANFLVVCRKTRAATTFLHTLLLDEWYKIRYRGFPSWLSPHTVKRLFCCFSCKCNVFLWECDRKREEQAKHDQQQTKLMTFTNLENLTVFILPRTSCFPHFNCTASLQCLRIIVQPENSHPEYLNRAVLVRFVEAMIAQHNELRTVEVSLLPFTPISNLLFDHLSVLPFLERLQLDLCMTAAQLKQLPLFTGLTTLKLRQLTQSPLPLSLNFEAMTRLKTFKWQSREEDVVALQLPTHLEAIETNVDVILFSQDPFDQRWIDRRWQTWPQLTRLAVSNPVIFTNMQQQDLPNLRVLELHQIDLVTINLTFQYIARIATLETLSVIDDRPKPPQDFKPVALQWVLSLFPQLLHLALHFPCKFILEGITGHLRIKKASLFYDTTNGSIRRLTEEDRHKYEAAMKQTCPNFELLHFEYGCVWVGQQRRSQQHCRKLFGYDAD